ncbi:MAG: (d)CMP kinase [Proteobacteria bacterium]|nr:(d)CMP kinase [Alphaproteobacteria bacterium]MDA0968384.1 (d)CMP kinase [Pseudomonadota bacterium]MDA1181595.1 (d)CMP kinase [Pseudomonadota bacterium]
MKKIITVDGPAGSGKEKISRYIARKYKLYHLDSGLLYRRLAYELEKKNIKTFQVSKIKSAIKNFKKLSLRKAKMLRKEQIGKAASEIAKIDFVRDFINSQQRLATKAPNKKKGFIIDGRDIGSVVFKKASLKLYIDVDVNIRAKRRYKQLIDNGEKSIYLNILKDIKLRDKTDKTRINSPLVVPKGAKIIDNSHTFKNTIAQIRNIIEGIN